jgi:hypothetical protein
MRPHTFEMPLQVLLTVFDQPEETVELPDDATVLTVKEWVYERVGHRGLRVLTVKGGKVLKCEDLLSSDSRFLQLKVISHGEYEWASNH